MKTQKINLGTLAEGAAGELFGRELQRVLEDIQDPNRSAKDKRSVTLTLVFKPLDDNREEVAITASASSKLAAFKPVTSKAYLGRQQDGELVAVTFNPRQEELFGATKPDEKVTPIPRRAES